MLGRKGPSPVRINAWHANQGASGGKHLNNNKNVNINKPGDMERIGRASNVRNAGRSSWRRGSPLLLPVASRRILRQLAREFRQTVVGVAQLDFSYR